MLLGSVGLTATVSSDSFKCRWLTSTFAAIETTRAAFAPPSPAPTRAAPTRATTTAATKWIRRMGSSFLERTPEFNAAHFVTAPHGQAPKRAKVVARIQERRPPVLALRPGAEEEISVTAHAPSKARPVRDAKVKGEKLAQSTGFEWLARAGFVARGLIYGIIGVLALEVAFGAGGQSPNQQGALKTIAQQPFGKVLL